MSLPIDPVAGGSIMYRPASFDVTDRSRLFSFMAEHSFATFVTTGARVEISHVPMLIEPSIGSQGVLLGHLAAANPQAKSRPVEGLAIFTGPHAYISPSWYEEPHTVPTWNYVAVHARGRIEWFDDVDRLMDLLGGMAERYEPADGWRVEPADPVMRDMCRAIVGFTLIIDSVEGKWKLSQNHSPDRQRRVRENLLQVGDEGSRQVSALMQQESTLHR
jgi:transcriptional regulator